MIVQVFIGGTVLLGLLVIIIGTIRYIMRERKDTELDNEVRLSDYMFWTGVICSLFFIFIWLYNSDGIFVNAVLCFFIWLGVSLIIAWSNIRIIYDRVGFTVRNFWGISTKFTYGDITSIRQERDTTLYMGKRRIKIERMSDGGDAFLYMVYDQYMKLHENRPIPDAGKRRWDPFDGHVDDPGEIVFMYFLLFFILAGAIIWFLVEMFTYNSEKIDNIQHQKAYISGYNIDGEDLWLISDEFQQDFRIRNYEFQGEYMDNLMEKCRKGEAFLLDVSYTQPKEGKAYYDVYQIRDMKGRYYRTYEQTNADMRRGMLMIVGIMSALEVIWVIYVIRSIMVGRNPEKYSERVRNRYFKEGYLHK
ncbi:MAG: hypothetical protein ACI4BB_08375 [Coprococcus sp.]